MPEAVSIPTRNIVRMRTLAVAQLPSEACGILVGVAGPTTVRVTRVLPCRNSAPAELRGTRFEIDPRVVLKVRRALRQSGEAIVGFFHSHPNGAPGLSPHDMEFARWWPATVWLVLPVRSGAVIDEAAWWLDTPESAARRLEVLTDGGGSAACTE